MNNLSTIKNAPKASVTQIKTFFPSSSTASLKVSKNPVAKSAPAAKETNEKEILCINFSLTSNVDTNKSDTLGAKKVINKIVNNILFTSGNQSKAQKIPMNDFVPE